MEIIILSVCIETFMHIPKPMSKHLYPTMSPPCCVFSLGTQSSSPVSVSIFLYTQSESPNRPHIFAKTDLDSGPIYQIHC